MTGSAGGTRTFLFSDIEGSTRMIQALADDYPRLLAEHRELIGEPVAANNGRIFGTEGDALFCVFSSPLSAIQAAAQAQRALASHEWPASGAIRVRMGIHTGDAVATGGDFVGLTLHEVARLMSAGHGGQVLVSNITRQLVGAALPANLSLRDLGEHRLRDLSLPERLFQLVGAGLADDFPPLRTLNARPNNLPVQLTSFVGRAELAEAAHSLAGTRLLTLSGPGGTGKTRLALQLAAESSEAFPGGVYFVPLDAVDDPALVPASIASALGLSSTASVPPEQRVVEFLSGKKVLLVLDNFEQIVDAARYVGQLLREAPELSLIVTSRILLRVYGETDYPVPPLGLPKGSTGNGDGATSAESAAHSEAVRLFVERAMAARPAFRLTDDNAAEVVDIVNRLDGLPLAIELAAARVRVLSVEAICARLDQRLRLLIGGARDLPERQQTLRGAIDWSYDLLEVADRRLFERFSIFAGGAFLTQAEPVCGPAPELGIDVLDGLASLADKSLVRGAPTADTDPRFTMLATIREYGREKLADDGDFDDLRRRHAEAFVALAEAAEPDLTGARAGRWLDRLELDHDNLRAALEWSLEQGDTERAFRLLAALWRFWQVRGHIYEGRRWADRVLAMPGVEALPPTIRGRGFEGGGSICYWQGDYVAANGNYVRALEAARESGDKRAIAHAQYNLGFAPLDALPDDPDEILRRGRPWLEQSLAIYEELADTKGIADVYWALAINAASEREYDLSERYALKGMELSRAVNDPFGVAWGAHMLGGLLVYRGEVERAEPIFREGLDLFQQSGDQGGMLLLLADYSAIAEGRGDRERQWQLNGAVVRISRETGIGVLDIGFESLGWHLPERPAGGAELAAWEAGERLSIEDAVTLALATPAGVPAAS